MLDNKKKLKNNRLFSFVLISTLILSFAFFEQTLHAKEEISGKYATIHLVISELDEKYIQETVVEAKKAGFISQKLKKYREAKIEFQEKSYVVDFAMHGTSRLHWQNEKRSFSIRIKSDKGTVYGAKDFLLIVPHYRRYTVPIYAHYIANLLKIPFPLVKPVRLILNNKDLGIYYFEEKINEEFLFQRNRTKDFIVQGSENWVEDHPVYVPFGVTYENGHITPFDFEISNLKKLKSDQAKKQYGEIYHLFEIIKQKDEKSLPLALDYHAFAKYEAYRSIFGSSHDAAGDNLRLVYSFENRNFYPIARSEGDNTRIKIMGGSFERSVNTYKDRLLDLFVLLNQDPVYRNIKYEEIKTLLTKQKEIFRKINELTQKFGSDFVNGAHDPDSSEIKKKIIGENLSILEGNFNAIAAALSYSAVYVNVLENRNRLIMEVLPDSVAPIDFSEFKIFFNSPISAVAAVSWSTKSDFKRLGKARIEKGVCDLNDLFKKIILINDMDENLHLVKTNFRIQLQLPKGVNSAVRTLEMNASNVLSGQKIPKNNLYLAIADISKAKLNRQR